MVIMLAFILFNFPSQTMVKILPINPAIAQGTAAKPNGQSQRYAIASVILPIPCLQFEADLRIYTIERLLSKNYCKNNYL
jgi:hypothetical protein